MDPLSRDLSLFTRSIEAFLFMKKTPHATLNNLATWAALVVATVLVSAKGLAWWHTNSLSLQASLLDSLLDVGASLLNFFAVRHALRPADAEHRFGHGKVEALASLGQSIFIAITALWILIEGVKRFFAPEDLQDIGFGSSVMVISLVLTAGLVLFQRFVIKRTHSLAIKADSLHYQTDFLTSAAVLVSFNLTGYFHSNLVDSIMGIGIALYIAFTSWTILRQSIDILMDREFSKKELALIKKICRAHPHVLGLHDLRTRSSGAHQFIQMHLDMQPDLSLLEAHTIGVDITYTIRKKFPNAEVLIHQDPFGHDEEDIHP